MREPLSLPVVERIVREHLARTGGRRPTMADVARAAGMTSIEIRRSIGHLRRVLGPIGECGPFRDELTYACLRNAADLIADGVKIEAAMRLSGFQSKSNFIYQFRAFVGCWPHEYRDEVSHSCPAPIEPAPSAVRK